jgi:hypothetical protein
MNTNCFKYVISVSLLVIYLNRGFFVTPYETNTNPYEINSLAEFVIEMITGQSNGIDEDGDSLEVYNFAVIVQPYIAQQLSQSLELWNKFPVKIEKRFFPTNETMPQLLVYGQIDHPPQQG